MLINLSKWGTICPIFEQIFLVKKCIVYQAIEFGIQTLFLSIWFEIDLIVHDRQNIAVT